MMEEDNQDKGLKDSIEDIPEEGLRFYWVAFLIVLAFIAIAIGAWYSSLFEHKKTKSELQKEYEVEPYVLSKWMLNFCPKEISQKYVGQKVKKVMPSEIYEYLGKPNTYPYFSHDRKIITKNHLRRAYNISASTLMRELKKIDIPEDIIGMSLQTYKDLNSFPPSRMILICQYLEEKGRKRRI